MWLPESIWRSRSASAAGESVSSSMPASNRNRQQYWVSTSMPSRCWPPPVALAWTTWSGPVARSPATRLRSLTGVVLTPPLRHDGLVSAPGVYKCPTACDPDCTESCHERHRPQYHRSHDPQECDQLQLGREVTPLAPPVYSRWRAEPPPPKATRMAYARAMRAEQVRWWRRLIVFVRGPGA